MSTMPGMGVRQWEVEYPASDGEPMAETGPHVKALANLFVMLRERYRGKRSYVAADMFIYIKEGDPSACRAPDLMVIKDVAAEPERASFFVWKEQAIPCVVIELTSEKTKDEDTGAKKEFYQQLGVREYFLFDPLGDCLPQPLIGYRLLSVADNGNGDLDAVEVRHLYEELAPAADGGLNSAELGLHLAPSGEDLLLFDLASGEQLIAPLDAYVQLQLFRQEVERLRQRAEAAEKRAVNAEKAREEDRQEAAKRLQQVEAEAAKRLEEKQLEAANQLEAERREAAKQLEAERREAAKQLEAVEAEAAKAKQRANEEIDRLKQELARMQGQPAQEKQGDGGGP